jgi:hypothetical protein
MPRRTKTKISFGVVYEILGRSVTRAQMLRFTRKRRWKPYGSRRWFTDEGIVADAHVLIDDDRRIHIRLSVDYTR